MNIEQKRFEIIERAKKSHFDVLIKNNIFTDSKNGEMSLNAWKMEDVLLLLFQEHKSLNMKIPLSVLRKRMGFEKNHDYKMRIEKSLFELKIPIELRDYTNSDGKKVVWSAVSLLKGAPKMVKEGKELYVVIDLEPEYFEYIRDKAGYTLVTLVQNVKCKTKYSFKLYQRIYLRYRTLPNKFDKQLVIIKQNIKQLNEIFGTTFNEKHPSRMMSALARGILELEELFSVVMTVFWDKEDKVFVFSWVREKEDTRCIIPYRRVDELVEWVISYGKTEIKYDSRYRQKLKSLIKKNELEYLREFYEKLLSNRYAFREDEITGMYQDGRYLDFEKEPSLF